MQQNQGLMANQYTLLSIDTVQPSTLGWHDQMGQRISLNSRCFGNRQKLSPFTDALLRDIGLPSSQVKPETAKRFWMF
jgi:hypothetical protein